MANETEKVNTIAIADIEKISGRTDDNIEKLSGLEFTGVVAVWSGTRAILAGGNSRNASGGSRSTNVIQYKTLDSDANTADFGDLQLLRGDMRGSGSNGTRAISGGGDSREASVTYAVDTIDYVTVASVGTLGDAGDLDTGMSAASRDGASNGILCFFMGGYTAGDSAQMEQMTISTTSGSATAGDLDGGASRKHAASNGDSKTLIMGAESAVVGKTSVDSHNFNTSANATSYDGDITEGVGYAGCLSSSSRVVLAGGFKTGWAITDTMQSFSVASEANSTDEDNLVQTMYDVSGTSDGTRGEFYGGNGDGTTGNYVKNHIQKITIASISTAEDIGDLTTADISSTDYTDAGAMAYISSQTGT